MENIDNIILKPILSEKSAMLSEVFKKYVFKVSKGSNKIEVKKAIEKKFNVEVLKVATMNFSGKTKSASVKSNGRVIRTIGNRSSWKKAVVTLKKGFSIDLVNAEG